MPRAKVDGPGLARPADAILIWQESYAQCFQEKRHYDLLSWSIGAAMLTFAAFIGGLILGMPVAPISRRLLLGSSILPFFLLWVWIYERNRVWGELCNETARDIERRFGVDGIQLRYMRAHQRGIDMRENSDLPADLRQLPADLVPGTPSPIRLRAPSMHYALYVLGFLAAAMPIAVAVLPLTTAGIEEPRAQ